MGDWIKGLLVGSIIIALIAAGFLIWGGLDKNPVWHNVDATILIVALLALSIGCARLVLGPVESLKCDSLKGCVAWALALGGGVLVIVVVGLAMWKFTGSAANTAIGLPLIVIVGVIVLLIVISLVTFVFSVLGLASNNQALGLPDGSVRSIIALMLLVLFSIVAIYLYNNTASTSGLKSLAHLKAEDVTKLQAQLPNVVAVQEPAASPAATPPAPPTFTVYYRDIDPAANDIAKQLIVLLGTLVTAVASFYFGSNAVASAQAAMSGQQNVGPVVTNIAPNPIPLNAAAQPLTLTGRNLGKITKVHLERKGQGDIDGVGLNHPDDSTVTVQVTTGTEAAKAGDWDVVVVEDDEKHAITVGKKATIG